MSDLNNYLNAYTDRNISMKTLEPNGHTVVCIFTDDDRPFPYLTMRFDSNGDFREGHSYKLKSAAKRKFDSICKTSGSKPDSPVKDKS